MSDLTEYAKLVCVNTGSQANKGFQAVIRLPIYKDLPCEWDYINYYCGLGNFECGVSTANRAEFKQKGELKWHWFTNTPDGQSSGDTLFADGTTIPICLERDANDQVVFQVFGATVYTSLKTFKEYNSQDNPARLILAASQSSPITDPLLPWRIRQFQVVASSMKYKDSSGVWQDMVDASKVTLDHWPKGITSPPPIDYRINVQHLYDARMNAILLF